MKIKPFTTYKPKLIKLTNNSFNKQKSRQEIVNVSKNIKNRSFLYGDFDKDGTPNADDKYPFDATKQGQVTEIMLVEELKKIKQHNKQWNKSVQSSAKSVGASSYRVKSVRSTLNKLRRKYLDDFHDIGGIRILCDNEAEVFRKVKEVKRKFPDVRKREKNYYKNPKNGYYMAYHLVILVGREKMPVEVQIVTKKLHKFYKTTHEDYKKGRKQDIKKLRAQVEQLRKEEGSI
jgi:ppGpp synthetase/RelA/SpoT-type nucleotidyltranferase